METPGDGDREGRGRQEPEETETVGDRGRVAESQTDRDSEIAGVGADLAGTNDPRNWG